MNTKLFDQFIDKEVEISVNSGKSYTGSLQKDDDNNVLVITPIDKYTARRFGPAFVEQLAVVSIRAIMPNKDFCEDKQMISASPYFQSHADDDCNSSES